MAEASPHGRHGPSDFDAAHRRGAGLSAMAIVLAAAGLSGGCQFDLGRSDTPPAASTTPRLATETTTTTEDPIALTPYTVVRGDTLIRIADRHGIHLNDLVRVNNIADPTKIFVGQTILIPPPPDPSAGPALTIAPATDPQLPPLLPTTTSEPGNGPGSG